jgi:hypothetical protein
MDGDTDNELEQLRDVIDMLVECVALSGARIAHLYTILKANGIEIDDPMDVNTLH